MPTSDAFQKKQTVADNAHDDKILSEKESSSATIKQSSLLDKTESNCDSEVDPNKADTYRPTDNTSKALSNKDKIMPEPESLGHKESDVSCGIYLTMGLPSEASYVNQGSTLCKSGGVCEAEVNSKKDGIRENYTNTDNTRMLGSNNGNTLAEIEGHIDKDNNRGPTFDEAGNRSIYETMKQSSEATLSKPGGAYANTNQTFPVTSNSDGERSDYSENKNNKNKWIFFEWQRCSWDCFAQRSRIF